MIQNGGFEDAGTMRGDADGWTRSFTSSAEEFADFDTDSDPAGHETFDSGWTSPDDQVLDTDPALELAEYESSPGTALAERFEPGWPGTTTQFLPRISAQDPADFGDGDEAFETGWGDQSLEMVTSTATFGAADAEDFDGRDWGGALNDSPISGEPAFYGGPFDDAAEDAETFENYVAPVVTIADPTANTLTHNFPGLFTAARVRFSNVGGDLPSPLREGVDYYVVSPTAHTMQLSTQPIIVATLDITDTGTGSSSVSRDPARYWTEAL